MTIEARISRGALEHNLRVLGERSQPARVMFVVKANGYGHGALEVSRIAYDAGIRHFGCLEIETALAVRSVVPDRDVQLLAWQFSDLDDIGAVSAADVDLGVGGFAQLDSIERAHAAGSGTIRVHLKVDTGLNRNGFPRGDWDRAVNRARELQATGAIDVVGVWTHIAETSDEADAQALREFESARASAESAFGRTLFAHLAASSASFRLPDFRFDAVRVGGHAYGIPSFDGITPAEMGLVPVMTLVGEAVADTDEEWGDVTSIGGGFADGIPGYASNQVSVTIGGTRHAIRAVLEDDVIAEGPPSDSTVYFFGDGTRGEQTVREWGDSLGTLGDEITCRISPRVPRVIVP